MKATTMLGVMETLFEHAKGTMPISDLEAVAHLSDHAVDEARRLSGICEGIACLVASDSEGGTQAGSFQDPDGFFGLMCALAHGFDTVAAMVQLGAQASYHATRRRAELGAQS